jgi:citrate synthase
MTAEFIPGLEGVPIAPSGVSFVDGKNGVLEYRGINIALLVEHSTFEETAMLLANGTLPTSAQLMQFKSELAEHRNLQPAVVNVIRALPEHGHPMAAIQSVVASLAMEYPCPDINNPLDRRTSAIRLIAKIPSITAAYHRMRNGKKLVAPDNSLSHAGNFYYMLTGKMPSAVAEKVLDVCLILHADHTMNASTFTTRVVGSTLADPFATISAAIGALSGPLHGGANEGVMHMLREIGSIDAVPAYIDKAVSEKQKIMGFGHRVYKTTDPRATVLKKYGSQIASENKNPLFDIAVAVEKRVTDQLGEKGIWPNVDFYSGLVYHDIGLTPDMFTPFFAVARVAGWVAHWLEQMQDNRIFRPTQIYNGEHNRPYKPMSERA